MDFVMFFTSSIVICTHCFSITIQLVIMNHRVCFIFYNYKVMLCFSVHHHFNLRNHINTFPLPPNIHFSNFHVSNIFFNFN